jgi:hypothetical protein
MIVLQSRAKERTHITEEPQEPWLSGREGNTSPDGFST